MKIHSLINFKLMTLTKTNETKEDLLLITKKTITLFDEKQQSTQLL